MSTKAQAQIRRETSEWFHESSRPNWLHRQIISVLKCGEVPKHVAIIMDGNRRYAKQKHIERQQGHMRGFDKLSETLEWCLDLGISEVTVYAFSIENFKRSADEVNGLMDLLKVKMQDLVDDRDKLEQHGVCVRILGNTALFSQDLQCLLAQVVSMSSSFNRAYLNICLAYTSREEITSSIKLVADGLAKGKLSESDVDSDLLESCMYTAPCQPVNLLLRTSGEVRLSDFLLWQSTYSLLSFVNVLWPEFSRWDLYGAVLFYQRHQHQLKEIKKSHEHVEDATGNNELCDSANKRKQAFLDEMHEDNLQRIQNLLKI